MEEKEAIKSIKYSPEYRQGFSEGYNEGFNKAFEALKEQFILYQRPIKLLVKKEDISDLLLEGLKSTMKL